LLPFLSTKNARRDRQKEIKTMKKKERKKEKRMYRDKE
jgi:hypothetical protein